MERNKHSSRLKRIATLVVLLAWTSSAVSAQTQRGRELEHLLTPGETAWITDSSGREEKARIADVSGDTVTVTAGERSRRLHAADISRIRVRQSDGVLNGALIGAGAAVASGLFLCSLMEPWENCRDDAGPMTAMGALGAGIGIGIDLLIRGKKTIYQAPDGSSRVHAAPLLTRHAAGLQVSVRF